MCKKLVRLFLSVLVLGSVWTSLVEAANSDPVGWWKFDEGSGTIAADSSGNGNDGKIIGATWVKFQDCV